MTSLIIGDESFQKVNTISIGSLNSIEMIDIGDDCFKSIANDVRFNYFPELISLRIGRRSFYNEDNPDVITKLFQIYNNSKLISIEIGEYSFSKFGGTVSMTSLPSLQNLTIGSIENESNNFMNVSSFSISSINETIIYNDI